MVIVGEWPSVIYSGGALVLLNFRLISAQKLCSLEPRSFGRIEHRLCCLSISVPRLEVFLLLLIMSGQNLVASPCEQPESMTHRTLLFLPTRAGQTLVASECEEISIWATERFYFCPTWQFWGCSECEATRFCPPKSSERMPGRETRESPRGAHATPQA